MPEAAILVPEPTEAALARSAVADLDAALSASGPVRVRVQGVKGEVIIPRSAFDGLGRVLAVMAKGTAVSIIPTDAELTTQQAADALNVSRPFVIGLLEAGEIAYRKVGTHRRVRADSLLDYLRRDDVDRRAAADALSAETFELGLA